MHVPFSIVDVRLRVAFEFSTGDIERVPVLKETASVCFTGSLANARVNTFAALVPLVQIALLAGRIRSALRFAVK
jgi:hypothetical protein